MTSSPSPLQEDEQSYEHSQEHSLIDEELWNIFTYYTIHGNPLSPEFMKNQQLMKLAKDCQMLSLKQSTGLTTASFSVICKAEVQRNKKLSTSMSLSSSQPQSPSSPTVTKKNMNFLSFNEFKNVLARLAPRVYPSSNPSTVYTKLLLENILPLASRRVVINVADLICEGSDLRDLLYSVLGKGIESIFKYYTELSNRRRKKSLAQTLKSISALKNGHGQISLTPHSYTKSLEAQKNTMAYSEYINFCGDFSLFSTGIVTTIQAGEIYMSSTPQSRSGSSDVAPDLTLDNFNEVILRMALSNYHSAHHANPSSPSTTIYLLKSYLLNLYKSVNTPNSTTLAINGRGTQSLCDVTKGANNGDLNLYGTSKFNLEVVGMWRRDGFVNYNDHTRLRLARNFERVDGDGDGENASMLTRMSAIDNLNLSSNLTPSSRKNVLFEEDAKGTKLRLILKQRPHIAEMINESINDIDDF